MASKQYTLVEEGELINKAKHLKCKNLIFRGERTYFEGGLFLGGYGTLFNSTTLVTLTN